MCDPVSYSPPVSWTSAIQVSDFQSIRQNSDSVRSLKYEREDWRNQKPDDIDVNGEQRQVCATVERP